MSKEIRGPKGGVVCKSIYFDPPGAYQPINVLTGEDPNDFGRHFTRDNSPHLPGTHIELDHALKVVWLASLVEMRDADGKPCNKLGPWRIVSGMAYSALPLEGELPKINEFPTPPAAPPPRGQAMPVAEEAADPSTPAAMFAAELAEREQAAKSPPVVAEPPVSEPELAPEAESTKPTVDDMIAKAVDRIKAQQGKAEQGVSRRG